MFRLLSIVFTVLLLYSCAAHTQKIVVPSKKFSINGPPSDWKTLIKTELAEFPGEGKKIPGGMFTALWSRNNLSKIGFGAVRAPEAQKNITRETIDRGMLQNMWFGFNKDIERLRLTECRKNLEHTIDSQRNIALGQGITMYELEASISCTSQRAKTFFKILLYMFSQDEYLYSFELICLKSDFSRDRQVLDAMIESFTFLDEVSQELVPAGRTTREKTNEVHEENQAVARKFIKIQEPDVVFFHGKVKYTVNIGDTLEFVRKKKCRSGSGECWIVKNVYTGEIGAVRAEQMQLRSHIIYSAQQPDVELLPYHRRPRRVYIEILQPAEVYKKGKLSFTVTAGDTLEVLQTKICRSGGLTCWAVRNMKTGKYGYVQADRMRSGHRVYTDFEREE